MSPRRRKDNHRHGGGSVLQTAPMPEPHPHKPTMEDHLRTAINAFRSELTTRVQSVASHQVTFIYGVDRPAAIEAFATYALIAGIGQGIRVNLAIATEMFGGGPQFGSELQRDVERIIGRDNTISDDFREDQRDPWFTECLGHALLYISREVADLGPPGPIEALTLVHTDVKDHGLDLVGLHIEQDLLGLNIAEAKASENNASAHGSATAALFAEVDKGTRDPEIRQKVQLLREALSPERQVLITPSFWRCQRAYLAIISYGTASSFRPTRRRLTYTRLAIGAQRIRLLAVPIIDYRGFFNIVADRVRALVPTIARAQGRV
jgi:hypothetical protein